MILTVSLNAGMDKSSMVRDFRLNERHYTTKVLSVPGGKAINVARVLREMDVPVRVLGFKGGHTGAFVEEGLAREGIASTLVPVAEESRVCLTIVDESGASHTELNEMGPTISAADVEALKTRFELALDGCKMVVLSGSLPPGVPPEIYADLLLVARKHGVPGVLDAKGEALVKGLAAQPLVVKPNREEFSNLLGRPVGGATDVAGLISELHARGAHIAMVSLGEDGAVASDGRLRLHASLRGGPIIRPVGSGDSMVAAYLWAHFQGRPLAECLRFGVAAGYLNARVLGAGFVHKAEVLHEADNVVIEEV